MKKAVKNILNKLPYIKTLKESVDIQGRYPAGHYYSPIPKHEDVKIYLKKQKGCEIDLPDINFQVEAQEQTLLRYKEYYNELPFQERQDGGGCRYHYDQDWFCYADAIFLYAFLRDKKPRRIVEVGSGYSSAVILDTVELFFYEQPEITFIDPYPDRLRNILRNDDAGQVRVLEIPMQEAPKEVFLSLCEGDLLFIDSSHVLKFGSDLHYLFTQILPFLPKGVYVHFHDIIYPFEYFSKWLLEGRYWNEAYYLRAFLAHNDSWSIHFFNSYVCIRFHDYIQDNMPLCIRNTGGSLYLKRL